MRRISRQFLFLVILFGLTSIAHAAMRVGPVSQYGQLQAGKNAAGEGRIYGSCPAYSTSGQEVQVKGMSLYWNISPQAIKFYNPRIITELVKNHNIQLIRVAVGVDEDWGHGNYFTDTAYYQGVTDKVVQTAIDNDIYVVIDYHSHKAHEDVARAKRFFERMAKKWGAYDNVIFDSFNEPACIKNGNVECSDPANGPGFLAWPAIREYSEQIVKVIREYSDNLIIVGTPVWSQQPGEAVGAPVADPANNIAYSFHYYAGAHSLRQMSPGVEKAMKNGLAVFVSEWGTVHPVNIGAVAGSNRLWQNWMDKHKLSSASWSLVNFTEDAQKRYGGDGQGSSYFAADFNPDNPSAKWSYSESGKWVNKNVFAKLPRQYTSCR